jgi:hypothetical protein
MRHNAPGLRRLCSLFPCHCMVPANKVCSANNTSNISASYVVVSFSTLRYTTPLGTDSVTRSRVKGNVRMLGPRSCGLCMEMCCSLFFPSGCHTLIHIYQGRDGFPCYCPPSPPTQRVKKKRLLHYHAFNESVYTITALSPKPAVCAFDQELCAISERVLAE